MQEEVEKYKPRLEHMERIGNYLLEHSNQSDVVTLRKEIDRFQSQSRSVLHRLQTFQIRSQHDAIQTVAVLYYFILNHCRIYFRSMLCAVFYKFLSALLN
jgi:hypothetical protein